MESRFLKNWPLVLISIAHQRLSHAMYTVHFENAILVLRIGLAKWPHVTSVELVWSYSLIAVHDCLVQCPWLSRNAVDVRVTLMLTVYSTLHAFQIWPWLFHCIEHQLTWPTRNVIIFVEISKRCSAKTLAFPLIYEDLSNIPTWSCYDMAPGTNVR